MTAAENARARGVTFDEAADDLRRRAVELERRAEIERLQARVAELEGERDAANAKGYAAGYDAGVQTWRVEVEQRDAEIARLRGELQDSRRVVEAMYQRAASAAEQRNGEIARLRAELAECRAEMAETGLEDRGA